METSPLEIVEIEEKEDESGDDDIIHLLCVPCVNERSDGLLIAVCGKDTTDEALVNPEMGQYLPFCALCTGIIETMKTCLNGHPHGLGDWF